MIHFFTQFPSVLAGTSLRDDGNMKIRGDQEDDVAIANRKKFAQRHDFPYSNLVSAFVEHTTNVAVVDNADKNFLSGVDALVTKKKDIFLGITVADCFPIVFYDPVNEVLGIAHAGWRGVVKEIIPLTIEKMVGIGADVKNIHVEVGPGISQAHFDFHFAEMMQEFRRYNQDKYVKAGSTIDKVKINLQHIILDQVSALGVLPQHIQYCTQCTFADEDIFFSARRHQNESFNAMLVVVGMKE